VSRIAVLPEFNFSRGENVATWFKGPRDEDNVVTMLVPGWETGDGLAIVTKLAPELVERAMQLREVMFAGFEKDTTDYEREIPGGLLRGHEEKRKVRYSASDFVIVANQLFRDKKGAIITPDLDLVCTYRRMVKWVEAQVICHRLGLPLETEIPCEIREYKSKLERCQDNLAENELKFQGTLPTTRNQKVEAVFHYIWCLGGKQVDARRTMKDGMGQWCWEWCRVADKYPNLDIISRIHNDQIKELSRTRAADIRKLVDAGVSDEDMEAYIIHPGDGNASKMMKKGDVESLARQCPNPFFRAAFKAAYKNNPAILAPILDPTPLDGVPFKDVLRKELIRVATEVFTAAGREADFVAWLQEASA